MATYTEKRLALVPVARLDSVLGSLGYIPTGTKKDAQTQVAMLIDNGVITLDEVLAAPIN